MLHIRTQNARRHAYLVVLLLPVLFALATPSVLEAQIADLEGKWSGTYRTVQSAGELELIFDRDGDDWRLLVLTTSPEYPSNEPDDAGDLVIDGSTLEFTVYWGTLAVRWTGEIDGDEITGVLAADHFGGEWDVKRAGQPR